MLARKIRQLGSRRNLILIGLLLVGYQIGLFLVDTQTQSNKTSSPPIPANTVQPVKNIGLPTRLIIPRLHVDAPVQYVGTNSLGEMGVPSNISDVGWYKNGALPGNTGTSVIAGHVNGPKGEPAVFAGLDMLERGDKLSVIDGNGLSISFVVVSARPYQQTEKPEKVFTSKSGSHLNLITCAGEWDENTSHFQERLVVFTEKE